MSLRHTPLSGIIGEDCVLNEGVRETKKTKITHNKVNRHRMYQVFLILKAKVNSPGVIVVLYLKLADLDL